MATAEKPDRPTWLQTLAAFKQRPVIVMLFLGFSAGLPLLLILATLSFWLREIGISRSAIGFFSWVGLAYALKFLWAPLVDRIALPVLTRRLGQRRGWMLLAQIGVICGILGIALTDPRTDILMTVAFATLVAFSSATQDIAIDAFRIESAPDDQQGYLAAAYQYGYRISILLAQAGALYMAAVQSWQFAFFVLAGSMGIGVATVLLVREPVRKIDPETIAREQAIAEQVAQRGHLHGFAKKAAVWFSGAVVGPFVDFFSRNGWMAVVVLALIGTFRLSDFTLGVMANPFYVDIGFTKIEVANIAKGFGLFMTLLGVGLGGVLVFRFGIMAMLLVSAFLLTVTNLLFAVLAVVGSEIWMLAITISADNIAAGISGTVFIAYLSSLTNRAYTATQYALFTSMMSLLGKLVAGFSGVVVDNTDWVTFFLYASTLGIPSILLIAFIWFRGKEGTPGYHPERLTGEVAPKPAE
ncbi:MAG: MFS transporter [Alphaproteobacteria bacterium]|nr:MFS transporter [Alphaproteobacteria bacterium]